VVNRHTVADHSATRDLHASLGGCSTSLKKGPRFYEGLFALIAFFDDGFRTRFFMLPFDDRCPLRRLTLLYDGRPIAVTVVVAGLTDCDASANRPDADAHTDFLSQSGGCESNDCRKYQSEFHGYFLCCFGERKIPRVA
jgi:hypothetical protein